MLSRSLRTCLISKPLLEVKGSHINEHYAILTMRSVSIQTIVSSVQALSAGLDQVTVEVKQLQAIRLSVNDRFVEIMKVSPASNTLD